MIIAILTYILLAVILYCLGSSAYYMVSKKHDSNKMARALTWRISLSILVFVLLIVGFFLGWIHPHPKVVL